MAAGLISWPAIAGLNQPAQVIGMPFISTDCVTYAMPASFGGFVCIEFNSTFLEQRDFEKLNIDFPLFTDAIVAGPTNTGESTNNVLPFGPIDLAFPSISQIADQSIKYSDTYFFTDTIGLGG
jgi:hypothetical protein